MNEHEITDLLERAGSGLKPDVAGLVAAGAARGRRRRRRRGAGIAAGGLAVAAMVGGVLVLPGGDDGGTPVAADPVPSTETDDPRSPIVRDAVPEAFASLFPGDVSVPLAGEGAVTDFRWNGYWVRVAVAEPALPDLDPSRRCLVDSGRPMCVTLADGTAASSLSWRGEPRARGYRSASGYTVDGWDVTINVSNAAGSKDGEILSRWAPVTEEQLVEAVAADVWFE